MTNSIQLPDAEAVFKDLVQKIQSDDYKDFAIIGIRTGGVWLAERLHQELAITEPLGILSVSFYRDDFDKIGLHSQVKPSEIPFEVEGARILLVDDVVNTGRTIRAAIMSYLITTVPLVSGSLRWLTAVGGNCQLPRNIWVSTGVSMLNDWTLPPAGQ